MGQGHRRGASGEVPLTGYESRHEGPAITGAVRRARENPATPVNTVRQPAKGVLSIEFAPRRILARMPGSDRHTGHGPTRAS